MSPDEERLTLLAEQRHALKDLDTDSQCTTYPGCACVACPPNRKRVIMHKLNRPGWKIAAGLVSFVIGLVMVVVILSAIPAQGQPRWTKPPCDGRARILCGVKPLPKVTPAVPSQVRRDGPISRG